MQNILAKIEQVSMHLSLSFFQIFLLSLILFHIVNLTATISVNFKINLNDLFVSDD